jgi:hypothetical protein
MRFLLLFFERPAWVNSEKYSADRVTGGYAK